VGGWVDSCVYVCMCICVCGIARWFFCVLMGGCVREWVGRIMCLYVHVYVYVYVCVCVCVSV